MLLAKKGKRACEAPATTAQCVAHKEKGGVKKGRISHPASKNQNKQANKERTKQKQGAKAGQVTEKRGEKKEEREAHFILPPLTHSHAASAASAATASVHLALALTFLVTASIPSPSPWFFFRLFWSQSKRKKVGGRHVLPPITRNKRKLQRLRNEAKESHKATTAQDNCTSSSHER